MPGGWCYNSWISREHTLAAKCSATTCTSMLRRSLAWTRHTACDQEMLAQDTGRRTHAFEFAVRDDIEGNNFSQGAYPRCVYRNKRRRMWYCVHSDDYVRLGAQVDHEWYRQEVSKRFIMTLRANLGPGAHHSREMRILNRVLTWRSSEAGRAERITYEEDPRHENFLLRDYGVEPRKSRGKTVPWDTPAFLAKNPRSGAYLPADQARSFKSRCLRNLFIALDRPDDQRRRNTEGSRQVLPHISAEMITDLTWCRFTFSN